MFSMLFTCCMTCGCPIERSRSSSEYRIYRALYWTEEGVRLTEPARNYDGRAYYGQSHIPIGYMTRRKNKGFDFLSQYIQDVFLFHSTCWDNLVECFGSKRIKLDILFDACQKAPHSNLVYYRSEVEKMVTPFVGATSPMTPPVPRGPWYDISYQLVRVAFTMLEKAWHPDPPRVVLGHLIHPPCAGTPVTDPFVLLPMELCLEIACLLSTADFHNLRLASRKMYPIFHEQTFWKSRFSHTKELQYIRPPIADIDIMEPSYSVDWRGLYRSTGSMTRELEIFLEVRMLNARMNRWLYEATMHPMAKPSHGPSPEKGSTDVLSKSNDKLRRELKEGELSALRVFETAVFLPLSSATVAVWVGRLAGKTYIAGLSFLVGDRPPVNFGHCTDAEPVILKANPLSHLWCAYSSHPTTLEAIAVWSAHANSSLVWAGEPKVPGQSNRWCYWYPTQSGKITVGCTRSYISYLSTPNYGSQYVAV